MSKKTYKVLLHAQVPKEIRMLPRDIQSRVTAILDALAENPFLPIAGKLHGRQQCFRVRVGNYRIVYEVHATEVVVYVLGIAHRKEIYRVILRR